MPESSDLKSTAKRSQDLEDLLVVYPGMPLPILSAALGFLSFPYEVQEALEPLFEDDPRVQNHFYKNEENKHFQNTGGASYSPAAVESFLHVHGGHPGRRIECEVVKACKAYAQLIREEDEAFLPSGNDNEYADVPRDYLESDDEDYDFTMDSDDEFEDVREESDSKSRFASTNKFNALSDSVTHPSPLRTREPPTIHPAVKKPLREPPEKRYAERLRKNTEMQQYLSKCKNRTLARLTPADDYTAQWLLQYHASNPTQSSHTPNPSAKPAFKAGKETPPPPPPIAPVHTSPAPPHPSPPSPDHFCFPPPFPSPPHHYWFSPFLSCQPPLFSNLNPSVQPANSTKNQTAGKQYPPPPPLFSNSNSNPSVQPANSTKNQNAGKQTPPPSTNPMHYFCPFPFHFLHFPYLCYYPFFPIYRHLATGL